MDVGFRVAYGDLEARMKALVRFGDTRTTGSVRGSETSLT